MILYIPNQTIQQLMSQILMVDGFGDLGFYTLGILYLAQMIGAVVATKITSSIGIAKTLVLGGVF